MDMDYCLSCNKQLVDSQFTYELASYCSIECINREDLALPLSPAPHAVNARLRARFEGPSPIGWPRKVHEPRSRSMSQVGPRVSMAPVIQLGFDAEDRAPSPESEVAWSLPAAGATRLVGSRWMGKDYEGIKCWAHGVRGFPDDDISDDDSDSDIFDVKASPILPIGLKTRTCSSRRAPSSTQASLTPRHMSVFTLDDTASLATPVTDNCLAQGYVESYQSSNTPPNQAAQRLRRFVTGSNSTSPTSAPKPVKARTSSTPVSPALPKSLTSEPVWIAQPIQPLLRPDAQRGRDWGGLYDHECEKNELASDRIGSYVPTSSWQRGRTRQRSHTEHLIR
ncbi:hypothetical protein RSOLAG22IIIB_02765 [Rhizoctonia solani]|uniref:Uncharacterized protein n=1 Tax=Rhizoctonia solani TaxID=456999 RepID=A0A0K6GHP6_9AGAM|nr:hypothetical protein RSOLAG22IIIB_02765 [Rhizoctonia solani]